MPPIETINPDQNSYHYLHESKRDHRDIHENQNYD